MYSLNDLTNAFVKTENPEEASSKQQSNHESILKSGIHVTETEAQIGTLFNMIGQQNTSLPLPSDHPRPSLEEITRTQAYVPTSYHNEIPEDEMYPVETEVMSTVDKSSFFKRMALRQITTEQEKELPVYTLNQMRNRYYLPSTSTSSAIPGYQHTRSGFPEIAGQLPDAATPSGRTTSYATLPFHGLGNDKMRASTMEVVKKKARYEVADYKPGISPRPGDFSSRRSQHFQQKQIVETSADLNYHLPPKALQISHVPMFTLPNQRHSVIMAPLNWNSTASHVRIPPQGDTDSSDDENENHKKYFLVNIDGTTTRFKLTREDWERIPINTFPSGGRLLSGDWTRIFLSKLEESNPWCSFRFKNNHVRSENSRKIHSAVFFRGGAECKRPECEVKVKLVIRKEKGKHVDVTYVGNVCHSSEPGRGLFRQKQIMPNYKA